MPDHDQLLAALTPLQRAVYETDQLGVNLRDSMRMVTARMGFFVGQERYLAERKKVRRLAESYGPSAIGAQAEAAADG